MSVYHKKLLPLIAAALAMILPLAGCGAKQDGAKEAGTFAMAAETSPAASSGASSPSPTQAATAAATGSAAPQQQAEPSLQSAPAVQPDATPAAAGVAQAPTAEKGGSVPEQAQPAGPGKPPEAGNPANPPSAAAQVSAPEAPPAEKTEVQSPAGGSVIKWSEFFDNEQQNTPSEKFWDMNGKTVTIKGYMGEVLSFEKHWFLIIPAPGAECPFDNGDETFWNKIMIAFTDKGEKLRYTSGPLQITGRLDVGIKIDESGYKTMFRLYEAKFEKLKE